MADLSGIERALAHLFHGAEITIEKNKAGNWEHAVRMPNLTRRERIVRGLFKAREIHQKWVKAYLRPEEAADELRAELTDPERRARLEKLVGGLHYHMAWSELFAEALEELGEGRAVLLGTTEALAEGERRRRRVRRP